MMPPEQMTPFHLAEQGEESGTQELRASAWVNDLLSLRRAWFSEREREMGKREEMRRRRRKRRTGLWEEIELSQSG